MRIKVIVVIAGVAGLALVFIYGFRPRPESSPATPITFTPSLKSLPPAALPINLPAFAQMDSQTNRPDNPANLLAGEDVESRIAQLDALAINDDADSLHLILRSLTDSDAQTREAALNAAIQFGSPDALPALQAALARTENPQEKVNLQDGIDFLKLPPLALDNTNSPHQ